MFLQERHGSGLRSRGASAASAGTRLEFVRALEPSTFFDEPVLTAARGACKATSEELRVIKNRGPSESIKLPLCQSLVSSRREANWTQRSWDFPDIDSRAISLATTWAFDMGPAFLRTRRRRRGARIAAYVQWTFSSTLRRRPPSSLRGVGRSTSHE